MRQTCDKCQTNLPEGQKPCDTPFKFRLCVYYHLYGKNKLDPYQAIDRMKNVLNNMATENDRKWWQFWISRWAISHEPLRHDAAAIMEWLEEHNL